MVGCQALCGTSVRSTVNVAHIDNCLRGMMEHVVWIVLTPITMISG